MLENCKLSGFADEIASDIKIQVKLLKELDIQFMELRSANGKNIVDYTLEEAKILKKYLCEKEIKVSAIGSPIGKILITEDFEAHFQLFQKIVEIAKIMETTYIRIFSFYIPEGKAPEQFEAEVLSRLERMIVYAKEHRVILLHENEKGIYGDVASRCLKLFEYFHSDYLKCTFDFANFIQCKQETLEAYEMLEQYIEYIHIKDALFSTGEVTPAGEGDGKVREIIIKLERKGYNGYLSLEPHLADFAALKTLERNAAERTLTDGETAFCIAYQALKRLL